jgi:hypothetical protein
MKLMDDLKEGRGYSHLKEEALDRTMWRARFGRGFEPVVRQTTVCIYIYIYCGMSVTNFEVMVMTLPSLKVYDIYSET